MEKNKKESRKRFRPGPHGGCEALLYEFREPPLLSDDEDDLPPALEFNVHSVTCIGVILMVSGSPAD